MRVRCKSKFDSNKILNLFDVTKKIYAFRLKKKLAQIKFLNAILRSCSLSSFLAFLALIWHFFLSSYAIISPHLFPVLNP